MGEEKVQLKKEDLTRDLHKQCEDLTTQCNQMEQIMVDLSHPDLMNQLEELKAEFAKRREEINIMKEQMKTMKAEMNNLETRMEKLEEKMNEEMNTMNEGMNTIKEKMKQMGLVVTESLKNINSLIIGQLAVSLDFYLAKELDQSLRFCLLEHIPDDDLARSSLLQWINKIGSDRFDLGRFKQVAKCLKDERGFSRSNPTIWQGDKDKIGEQKFKEIVSECANEHDDEADKELFQNFAEAAINYIKSQNNDKFELMHRQNMEWI